MEDTLDVLQISRDAEIPSKKRPRRPKRPDGISREAYSLLDGNHPVVQSGQLKKSLAHGENSKPRVGEGSSKVTYKHEEFTNEAREDGLKLKRWIKYHTDGKGNFREAKAGVYPFARLDVAPEVVCYTDSEWQRYIAPLSTQWTKEETDYLLKLCRRFSMRFVIVHDRYEWKERSLEELKERYYSIAHCLAVVRSGEEPSSRFMQRNPYDAFYEKKRRDACRTMFAMTVEEEIRDNAILEEAEKIEAQRLEGAEISFSQSSQDTCSETFSQLLSGRQEKVEEFPLHDAQGSPWRPPPGVYVRGVDTKKLFQQGKSPAEEKVLREFSVENCFPSVCNKKLLKAWIDLRNDASILANLRETLTDHEDRANTNLNS